MRVVQNPASSAHTGNLRVTQADLIRDLQELIAALDRRVPRVERKGEISIARDAALLREKAPEASNLLANRRRRSTPPLYASRWR